MVVWRGYGILVIVFTLICFVLAKLVGTTLWGDPLPPAKLGFVCLLGMWLGAAAVFGLHKAIRREEKPRVLIDKHTGREVVFVKKHDLFFVPLKFWPYVLLVLGVGFVVF